MENPKSWGKVKRTIDKAVAEHNELMKKGFCGSSLISHIYNKLREANFICEDTPVAEENINDVFNKKPENWII